MGNVGRLLPVFWLSLVLAAPVGEVYADGGESTRVTDPKHHASTTSGGYPYREKSEYVLKELDLKPGDVVVDIGAGDGWWTERMVPFVGEKGVIHAAEINQKMVDKLKQKFADVPEVRPYLCKTDSTELPEESCDLVFLSQTYHHLKQETRADYLRHLRKVVKPTGRVCVIEKYPLVGGGDAHGTMLSRLAQEAEESGWVPVRFELITRTNHYLAILVQKDLFPAKPKGEPKGEAKGGPKGEPKGEPKEEPKREKAAASDASPQAESIGWNASGKGGAVAAGRSGAVAAGIQLLQEGGNAADAAAATLTALAVTDYGSFAIGGEIPLLIYDAKRGEVKALCGVGRAPLDPKAIRWYYANGIPSRGSMKAAPSPGAVHLCVTLLELYGTKSFDEVVAPTLAILDAGGRDWYGDLAVTLRKLVEAEQNARGTREQKLAAARDRFYRGDIADELEAWYVATGALLRKGDLAAHQTLVEDPVAVGYHGYTVYKCGPWTQGPVLCQALRLLEGLDLKGMGHLSPDYIHVVTEALKLAFADRDEYYGDPLFADVPLETLLSDRYTAMRRPLIDMRTASLERRPGDPWQMRPLKAQAASEAAPARIPVEDTTTCVVADRWGNVVAATPSCNLLTNRPGPSGVNQGNRIRSLNTTPGHPNRVEPGKRPRVTLTPTLVTKDGRPVLAISVAGGDLQDQTNLNVLLNHVEFGMLPEDAVTAPRFSTGHHQNSFDPNPDRAAAFVSPGSLRVNEAVPEDVRAELSKRGHKVSTTPKPIAHPVMIYIDQATGTIRAAGDPNAGRHAAALE